MDFGLLEDQLYNLNEQDVIYARSVAVYLQSETTRKKAFISLLGRSALVNYLNKKNIETVDAVPLHEIFNVLNHTEIADLTLKTGVRIDVRTVIGNNYEYMLIPKTHFQYKLIPDIYVCVIIDPELKSAQVTGFVESSKLENLSGTANHYIVKREHLKPIEEFSEAVKTLYPIIPTFRAEDHLRFENLYLDYLDDRLGSFSLGFFLKHMTECIECRELFNVFAYFEKTLKTLKGNFKLLNPEEAVNKVYESDSITTPIIAEIVPTIPVVPVVPMALNVPIAPLISANSDVDLSFDFDISNNNQGQELSNSIEEPNEIDICSTKNSEVTEISLNQEETDEVNNEIDLKNKGDVDFSEFESMSFDFDGEKNNPAEDSLSVEDKLTEYGDTEKFDFSEESKLLDEDINPLKEYESFDKAEDFILEKNSEERQNEESFQSEDFDDFKIVSSDENGEEPQSEEENSFDGFEMFDELTLETNYSEFEEEQGQEVLGDENLISLDGNNYNNDDTKSVFDDIQGLEFVLDKDEENEEEKQLEASVNKKLILVVCSVAIAGIIAVTMTKSKEQKVIPPEQSNLTSAVKTAQSANKTALPIGDLKSGKLSEKNAIVNKVSPIVKLKHEEKRITKKLIGSSGSVRISKISWAVGKSLAKDSNFVDYLSILGEAVKINLSQEFLTVNKIVSNTSIKVMIIQTSDGTVQAISMTSGSGSANVDKIIIKTVKDTLGYIKPPELTKSHKTIKSMLIINL